MTVAGERPAPSGADVLVVGAGIVGAAVAWRLAAAGAEVLVIDRHGPAAGSSSSGEGNVLVSDKLPGADLALALRSVALWRELAAEAGGAFEFEPKGGVVVAATEDELASLTSLSRLQAAEGVEVELLGPEPLAVAEPNLSRRLAGAAWYPQDCQVQPMRAVAFLLAAATRLGCSFSRGVELLGAEHGGRGEVVAVTTSAGTITVGEAVVNATGPWAGETAARLGGAVPVEPRRGHVLVTEPVPLVTAHKVYESGYVGSIHDDGEGHGTGGAGREATAGQERGGQGGGWSCSGVVEATASGTMLLGSSREFAGWSAAPDPAVVAAIAARAVALYPVLAGVRLLRTYVGFRPATPDRLPAIGFDASCPNLLHATGHEGAGIGLAPATAELAECLVLRRPAPIDPAPYDPGRRFPGEPGAVAS